MYRHFVSKAYDVDKKHMRRIRSNCKFVLNIIIMIGVVVVVAAVVVIAMTVIAVTQ